MSQLLEDIGVCPATLLSDPLDCPPAIFEALLDAVSSAGDSRLSVWTFHAARSGVERTEQLLADRGLRAGAVEAALAWTRGASVANRAEAERLVETAVHLGAGVVVAVNLESELSAGPATEGLAELGRMVGEAGLRLAVEFLPWSGIPTLAVANDLVVASESPAAGILIDCWHWQRQPGGPDLDLLRSLPGDRITYVQLCDAGPVPQADTYGEAMSARRLPGDGVVDLSALVEALDEIGARPFVASEVFSAELVALGPDVAARRIHDACAALRDRLTSLPGTPDA